MEPSLDWKPPRLADSERRRQLLVQADLAFDQQHAIFGALETKAGQYLTVGSIGLAAAAAFFPAEAAASLRTAPGWLFAFTIGTGIAVLATGLAVILCALQVLRVQNVCARRTKPEEVFDLFTREIPNFEEQFADRVLTAADELCALNIRKGDWLGHTLGAVYLFLLALLLFGLFASILVAVKP